MPDTSQPTVLDYASPTTWRIRFNRVTKVEWFCTNVTLPGINLGEEVSILLHFLIPMLQETN